MEKSWLNKGRRAYNLKQYDVAIDCFEKAIAEGDAQAMYLAACMYQSGMGVPKSICKAKTLFRQAADKGHKKAANALVLMVDPSYVNRCAYIVEACKLREAGKYKEAMEEFLSIAGANVKPDDYTGECMYWIGMMYKWGQGVPKDEVIADEWLRKAVDNCNWKALMELKLDECVPEVICDGKCAKATAYVYHNIRRRENPESILSQLARSFKSDIKIYVRGRCIDAKDCLMMLLKPVSWTRGTKLDIYAEGGDAGEAVKSIVDLFYSRFSEEYLEKLISQERIKRPKSIDKQSSNTEYKEFNEAEFLSQCMSEFANIRKQYNLDEDILRRAEMNPMLEEFAALVIEGCTEQGILEIKKRLPEWEKEQEKYRPHYMFGGIMCFSFPWVIDATADSIRIITSYYNEKCRLLCGKMEQLQHFDEVINSKEKLAADGDVSAMLFLGKAYEKGKLGRLQDNEKACSYYQMAMDAWAGDLSKRYTVWLEQAVKNSGLEKIGQLGREYIEGSFAEAARKNPNAKLKNEIKWLNKAIKEGDGWAAFTKGNICYYGYGRWKERKKEAYNNYIKASKSKESIWPLELEKMSFDKTKTIEYEMLETVLRIYKE